MRPDDWIVVPNWERFQHYKNRNPAWIKVYTELEDKDEWCRLTAAQRGVLVTIWIEYARSRGQIKCRTITERIPIKSVTKSLEALNHAGWVHFVASKPLAQSKREKEEKAFKPVTRVNQNTKKTPLPTDVREWLASIQPRPIQ